MKKRQAAALPTLTGKLPVAVQELGPPPLHQVVCHLLGYPGAHHILALPPADPPTNVYNLHATNSLPNGTAARTPRHSTTTLYNRLDNAPDNE